MQPNTNPIPQTLNSKPNTPNHKPQTSQSKKSVKSTAPFVQEGGGNANVGGVQRQEGRQEGHVHGAVYAAGGVGAVAAGNDRGNGFRFRG